MFAEKRNDDKPKSGVDLTHTHSAGSYPRYITRLENHSHHVHIISQAPRNVEEHVYLLCDNLRIIQSRM